MPALVAGILNVQEKDVDGRNKSGHDERWTLLRLPPR